MREFHFIAKSLKQNHPTEVVKMSVFELKTRCLQAFSHSKRAKKM
jgi:hypothetical protein